MKKLIYSLAFLSTTLVFGQKAKVVKSWPSREVYNVQPNDTIGIYVQFDKPLTDEQLNMVWHVNGKVVYFASTSGGNSSFQDSLTYIGKKTYYGVSHVKVGGSNLSEGRFESGTGYFQVLVINSGIAPADWPKSSGFTINIKPTGIEDDYLLQNGVTLVAYYDLEGRKVEEPKGLVIAVYSDGRRKKKIF